MYFGINIVVLVDLLEDAFFAPSHEILDSPIRSNSVAVLLFFCTLKEALFEHFLHQLFGYLKVPDGIRERLITDNRLFNQKINKLFPAVVGDTWKVAIQKAGESAKRDFSELDELLIQTSNVRNDFLHDAQAWDISPALACSCVDSIDSLFRLFVALHNHYIWGAKVEADFIAG